MTQSGETTAGTQVKRRHRPDYRLVKIHRTYTVEEIARLLGSHKNTVRQWIKAGLPTIDERRPILILGSVLRTFLHCRRTRRKHPCAPGQMYCVGCRAPKFPAGRMADYRPRSDKFGNLSGICPDCDSMMYRCVSLANLGKLRGEIDITFPQALQRLGEIGEPTLNSDLIGDDQP